ncbi:MAG TPA: polysaccharide biosynthesis tyrosine autokinase [Planctomycetota bacterium]
MTQGDPIRLAPAPAPAAGEADAGRMLQMLWRGKWVLLSVPLVALGLARLWLDRQEPIYVATAQVQVDARAVNPLKSGAGEATNKPRTVLKQQQSLLKSVPLLKRIGAAPGVAELPTFAPERLGDTTLLGKLNECLTTGIDVETDRFFIYCYSPFRADTVTVVDEALRVFIEFHREKKKAAAEELAGIVRSEWDATKKELETTDAEIARLQAENSWLAGAERTPLQTKLESAGQSLNAARLETRRLAAELAELRALSQDPAGFRARGLLLRSKAQIPALEEEYKRLQGQREELLREVERLELREIGSENPHLIALRQRAESLLVSDERIGQEYAANHLGTAEMEHARALRFEQGLETEHEALLAQVAGQNATLDRIKTLMAEREHLRARVAGFDDRITQLELENQTGALNLTVIEHARAATRPVYPETEKTYLYALGAGGILAFGLVLLLGLSDRRVREVEDVPGLLGTSVLGVLPELPRGSDRVALARLVEEDPHSLAAEAFRSVRTATVFALPGGSGVVVVTSASTGEGKSVCASNLACALARAGKKTLLIDADMRRPAQHEIYGVPLGTGLAGLLGSAAPLKGVVVPRVASGLDLLPAGEAQGRAAELCEGPVLVQLLASLRESYECIVIDAPPVLETSEARVLASQADAVVFVLRLEVSRAPNLKRAAGILSGVGARILGCLPNGARARRGARAYTGGINYGPGPNAEFGAARPARPPANEGETDRARARGTDFLGLEEKESA